MTSKTLRILGIHLAGAHTRKTALVRGFLSISKASTGHPPGIAHDLLAQVLHKIVGAVPIFPESARDADGVSPLVIDNLCPSVGPQMGSDGDTRLCDVVTDMGGADVIAIDAPLSLPPCVKCAQTQCPGTTHCPELEVAAIRALWEGRQRKSPRKSRMPLPYLDRYFETFARTQFEHPALSGSFEFESILGSGKAPLTARAQHIAHTLRARCPQALIVEVNSAAATLGWTLSSGFRPRDMADLRSELDNRGTRAHVLKRLESTRHLTRSASLDEGLFLEIAQRPELFLATITALTARGLLTGETYCPEEFLCLTTGQPLSGWPLIPREIIEYGWQH